MITYEKPIQIDSLIPSAKYIDNGFWRIAPSVAGKLVNREVGLPRHGYERLIEFKGVKMWLARARYCGAMVWSVRLAR